MDGKRSRRGRTVGEEMKEGKRGNQGTNGRGRKEAWQDAGMRPHWFRDLRCPGTHHGWLNISTNQPHPPPPNTHRHGHVFRLLTNANTIHVIPQTQRCVLCVE